MLLFFEKNINIFFMEYKKLKFFFLLFLIFPLNFIFINIKIKNNKNKIKISLVIPTKFRDLHKIIKNIKFYFKFIDCIKNLVIIGDENVEKYFDNYKSIFYNIPYNFIYEGKLINVVKIKDAIKRRKKDAVKRTGWYIQQFVKMAYSIICKDDYYLIWDSDTIPVKPLKLFDKKKKPFFHVRKIIAKPYFITLKKVFPNLGQIYNYSFVTEHILIKTEIMKNLIQKIEENNNLIGDIWYEKIINSIDLKYLGNIGFSEFETYGTFSSIYYKNLYIIKPWKSLREGKQYYNIMSFHSGDIKIIAKKYDAISFEH